MTAGDLRETTTREVDTVESRGREANELAEVPVAITQSGRALTPNNRFRLRKGDII
jgi:hypothetical protein